MNTEPQFDPDPGCRRSSALAGGDRGAHFNGARHAIGGSCANGREAIEQFRALWPDGTLMDLQMPVMSGLEAIAAIRGDFPDARIIVLTTYTGDVELVRATKAGASAFLVRNLAHQELLDTIRSVHRGRKVISPEASSDLAADAIDDTLTSSEGCLMILVTGSTGLIGSESISRGELYQILTAAAVTRANRSENLVEPEFRREDIRSAGLAFDLTYMVFDFGAGGPAEATPHAQRRLAYCSKPDFKREHKADRNDHDERAQNLSNEWRP